VSLRAAKHGLQRDLRAILGERIHEMLLKNAELSIIPQAISSCNMGEKDIEFVVQRSPSRIHVINTFESIDENIERILFETRHTDAEVMKLTKQFTFRLFTCGLIFDARDIFEILELSRCFPDQYKLKMYKYTDEEFKARQNEEARVDSSEMEPRYSSNFATH
jgi:hypothetical protein